MGIAYNTSIVRDGLVLHLDAANPKSYPGTGTSWNDLSGLGNNGTLVNGVGYSTDNKGAMVFDGVNDYFLHSNNAIANNLNEMTVSCWVYADWSLLSSSIWCPIVTKLSDAANGSGWDFGVNSQFVARPNLYFFKQGPAGAAYRVSQTPITTGTYWMNIVASYSGGVNSTALLFINGVSMTITATDSTNFSSISTTSSVAIASRDGSNSYGRKYTPMRIGNTIIYNRQLSGSEVKQNFEALRGRYGV